MTAAAGSRPEPTVDRSGRPSPGRADEEAIGELVQRVNALDRIVEIGRRHNLGVDLEAAARIGASARSRLRHGGAHTVVALAGSTGSGKSSLLNAITGVAIAETGLLRPTTAVTQAVVYPDPEPLAGATGGGWGADGLLDWLDVQRRHHLPAVPADLRGLVLLDLPDFDSTEATHRAEVERLVALVDLMIWVTDPQKYADEALHSGFLGPLSSHAAVMEVVLNKVDTLRDEALHSCLADLDRLLDADGLGDIHPLAVSATTGQGIDALRGLLAAEVAARQAMLDRVAADLTVAAARLGEIGLSRTGGMDDDAQHALVDGLAQAIGVDSVAALVAAQHRRDARLQTGWPPLRWARRFRRAPIAALPRASGSHVARAEVSQSLRGAADAAVADMEPAWRPAIRGATIERTDDIVAMLDRRTSVGVDAVSTTPRWWSVMAGLHGLVLAVAAIGALWLVALFLLDSLLLLDVDALTPRVRAIPLPTLLLAGGLATGVLMALLARPFVAIGARRRAGAARRRIGDDVAAVAAAEVVEPLDAVLADRRLLGELQAQVGGRG